MSSLLDLPHSGLWFPIQKMFVFFFSIAFTIKSLSVPFKNIRKYRSAKEQWIQISVHVCSGLPFPPPGFLPHPGIKPLSPASPALQVEVDSLPLSYWGSLVPPLFPQYLFIWLHQVLFAACRLLVVSYIQDLLP